MKERENHLLTDTILITVASKSIRILAESQKYSSTRHLITKQRSSNLPVEKPSRHRLNQVIKVNIPSTETYQHHILPNRMHWQGPSVAFGAFLQKMHHMRKLQTNPNLRGNILQRTGQYPSKVLRSWKRNYPQLEEAKGTCQLKDYVILGWILDQKRDISKIISEIWIKV